jgi:L-rhamnose isomerase
MNRKFALALVLALSAAGNAFADDITVDAKPFVSTASRADVQAQLAQFKQSGSNPWSNQYDPLHTFSSKLTRAEVAADFIASRDEVAAFTGEDSGSAYLARPEGVQADTTRLAGRPQNAQ